MPDRTTPLPAPKSPDAAPVTIADHVAESRWRWLKPWAGAVAIVIVLAAALLLLRAELSGTGYHRVMLAFSEMPRSQIAAALTMTVLAYLLLSGYDLLALRYIGASINPARVLLTSSLSYGISQTLGFPLLTGNAVRVRFWSAWGLSTEEMARAAAFVSTTFTAGIVTVCGAALLIEPEGTLQLLHLPDALARVAGVTLLACSAAYVFWAAQKTGTPIRIAGWEFPVPSLSQAASQIALALLDWGVASLVLFVLLPRGHVVEFVPFLGLFVLAQTVGVLSHVPGGLGVFETLMVLALKPLIPAQETVVALLAYRAVYYLMPFVAAVVTLLMLEVARQREHVPALIDKTQATIASVSHWARVLQPLLPTAIGTSTFLGGVILLFSGATPAAHGRVRILTDVLPLGLVEFSHFIASVVGVGLLILGWALRRRLDAAWGLTVTLLCVGIVSSMLKGLDYEEALALSVALLLILPARSAFYRKTALTSEPLSPGWIAGIVAVVGASIWVGAFAYRHVDYSSEMWWEFAARGNAPRFLRATAGVVAVVMMFGLSRLLRHAAYSPVAPSPEDITKAAVIVRSVAWSTASLALLGDKSLLYNDEASAFVMYGVAGRSWIAMGDPVGPLDGGTDAAWRFKLEADAHGAWPVFYQVGAERLPLYIDLGLTLLKLGEEAFVSLPEFSLSGADRRWMRRNLNDAEKAGLTFDVVPASDVPALLPTLRAISDEWLGTKSAREKGFSLGRFDEAYLKHFPMALVRAPSPSGPQIVAFANLWCGAAGGEISPDLMRRSGHAPRGVMDFLFIQLLLWGKERGYSTANLGMAPLAGLASPTLSRPELAPLWSRAGAFVYGRGEQFYNFQGLRAFKEKFTPIWTPRYLASPGGFALPRVLANVTTLISGGVTGIVHK
jgi:phosphatidylglycerol lysyltransferase